METTHLPSDTPVCFEDPKRVVIARDIAAGEAYVIVEFKAGGGKKITFPKPRLRVRAGRPA